MLVLPACLFLNTLAFASDVKEQEPKRLLVIYSHHEGLPWEKVVDDSLRATLASKSTGPVELSVEHADRARHPGDAYLKEFVNLLRQKYRDLPPDVVVGVDDEATDILLKHGEELFPEVPLVFVTAERKELQRESLKHNMTSLSWGLDIKGSVDLICEILPHTSQIFIITGSSPSDRAAQQVARQQLDGYTERIKINYLPETTLNDLLEKVARLPERSALLYMTFIKDSEGKSYVPAELAPDISAKANAPTFGIVDTFIGNGIVGGRLLSAEIQGRRCAEVSLRILGGEAAEDIDPIKTGNVTMFDWRQLRRWGIDESALPQGSIVRFRPPSLWETYRTQMVSGSAGVIILIGALLVLFGQLQLRKKAEARLREAEENYRSVVENAYEGIAVAQDEKVVFWNARTLELTGYSAAELSSASFLDFIHPDDRSMVQREHERRLSGEVAASRYRIRFLAKDGHCRWALIGSAQIEWKGRPASLAIISDITDLVESNGKLKTAQAVAQVGFLDWDLKTDRIVLSTETCRMFGLEQGATMLTPELVNRLVHPDDLDAVRENLELAVKERKPYDIDHRIVRPDGSTIWVRAQGRLRRDPSGQSVSLLGTAMDITKRKVAELALREAEEKYRTVADFTYDWEYWEGVDGSMLYVSPSCERITGYSPDDLTRNPRLMQDMVLKEDRQSWLRHREPAESGKSEDGQLQFRITTKDGQQRWIEHVCTRVTDMDGKYRGLRGSHRDITQLKKAEEDARNQRAVVARLNRTAALEHLSGSIAHELNQPLTGILSSAQACELLIKQGRAESSEMQEIVADIAEAAKHAGDVTRNLRDFYRTHAVDFKTVDMNALVSRTLRMLHTEFIMRKVHVDELPAEAGLEAHGNAVQLQQVLLNVIQNAYEAMNGLEGARIRIWSAIEPGASEVTVVVEDNGPGIAAAAIEGIFEPLFTSKPGGTGMGLAISRSIIKAHGGRLWAENRPEGGARVAFAVPALKGAQ
jgi:PAS domain S-box-containing protein